MRVDDIQSIQIRLASPEEILSWSHGEVLKPETINYRTQKPEKDGLFCERIFGPEKDFQCYCGKYRGVRYKEITCDKCGVEIINSSVRRDRVGNITLATPCSHIWFLRGVPSIMGMILDISSPQLEKVIYFNSYIITQINEVAKEKFKQAIETEYKQKYKNIETTRQGRSASEQGGKHKSKKKDKAFNRKVQELKAARDRALAELLTLEPLKVLSEIDYHNLALKYGEAFEAGTGAQTLRKLFAKIDLEKEIKCLKGELEGMPQKKKKSARKRKPEAPAPMLGPKKRKVLSRLRILEGMAANNIRPEWMFLTVIPVLPPDLRPMVQLDGGRYASSDLNDLYRRVINRNNRLKYLLEISAPEVIIRNEKRMLQEAVDALIDNGMRKGQTTIATTGGRRLLKSLADMLKGKQGRFRQNLLGKRVDYSGRSVIVVGPELRMDQVGLPKKMALELFKPFVIRELLNQELVYNIRGAARFIEDETDEVWAALERVVKDKLVLLNRAPTLHRLSIQAFEPILIEGEAIQVHPLVCKSFNADFDGDQMAVHVPLSSQAQAEARQLLRSSLNLLKPATGTPVVHPSQDIVLGCYFLTGIKEGAPGSDKIFASTDQAILAYEFGIIDLRAKIKVQMQKTEERAQKTDRRTEEKEIPSSVLRAPSSEFIETSVGRILFNEALPKNFRFINEQLGAKGLEKIATEIIEGYGGAEATAVLDDIKRLGFEFATFSGISWGMDDLVVPARKKEIIASAEQEINNINSHEQRGFLSRKEKKARAIEVWQRAKSEIEKLVPDALKGGSVFSIIEAGARGSWVQPVQMAGMKGLVINPAGEIIELPVKASFKEGLNVLEYFISTHGARKGTADTALRTSAAGYLTRRLVDVAHEVVISENDCRGKDGLVVSRKDADEISQNFLFKILGRVALEKVQNPISKMPIVKEGEIIDRNKAKEIIDTGLEQIRVASPLTCRSARGVCQKCYGWDLGSNKKVAVGEAVGIVAAQAIGEPGTQLTMKTFHTGGVAGGGDITTGLPRVEEIFEARTPKGEAPISLIEGMVSEITDDGLIRILPKDTLIDNSESDPEKKKKKSKKELRVLEYKVSKDRALWVKKGQKVKPGTQLSEGNVDLHALFRAAGFLRTCQYIIKEIQAIYSSQGASIHDKHIEVIIRQMFSRVRVIEPGDTRFTLGELVEKAVFLEENATLEKAKKNGQAKPVLLGISKVALSTDSFLSAASFQETSRVLIKAAIEGKEDKLRGLKENVIIGKLIPAGTGFRK